MDGKGGRSVARVDRSDVEDEPGPGGRGFVGTGHLQFVAGHRLHVEAPGMLGVGERFAMNGRRGRPIAIMPVDLDLGHVIEDEPFRILQEDELFQERDKQLWESCRPHRDLMGLDTRHRVVAAHHTEEAACCIGEERVEIDGFDLEAHIGGMFEDPVGHDPARRAAP